MTPPPDNKESKVSERELDEARKSSPPRETPFDATPYRIWVLIALLGIAVTVLVGLTIVFVLCKKQYANNQLVTQIIWIFSNIAFTIMGVFIGSSLDKG